MPCQEIMNSMISNDNTIITITTTETRPCSTSPFNLDFRFVLI